MLVMELRRVLARVTACGGALCAAALYVPTAQAQAPAERGPYVGIGLAVLAPERARFVDGVDAGHAYLYGGDDLFTAGDFGTAPLWYVAAGVRATSRLRTQVEFNMVRQLAYRGTANYAASGTFQPSTATLRARQLLVAGMYDLATWRIGPVLQVEAYVGGGAGFTAYDLDNFVQQFPDPDNPAGYLQRGPAGEVPLTRLPAGSGRTATGMLTAGVAMPVAGRARLDVGYRYTDAGVVGTLAGGDILIVRYNRGHRSEVTVPINATIADFKTHAVLAHLRVEF